MRAHHVLPFLLALPSCAGTLGETDAFSQRVSQGCDTPEQCDRLVEEAQARNSRCSTDEIGKLRCSDTRADLYHSKALAKVARERQSGVVSAQQTRLELDEANKRIAELERQLAESKVKAECYCAPPQPQPTDAVEELRDCRVTLDALGAENEALKAARDKAQASAAARAASAPRAPAAPPAPRPAPPSSGGSGRLQCCDGSFSLSCSCGGSHRGCCSRHGGVCGCN